MSKYHYELLCHFPATCTANLPVVCWHLKGVHMGYVDGMAVDLPAAANGLCKDLAPFWRKWMQLHRLPMARELTQVLE